MFFISAGVSEIAVEKRIETVSGSALMCISVIGAVCLGPNATGMLFIFISEIVKNSSAEVKNFSNSRTKGSPVVSVRDVEIFIRYLSCMP